MTVYIVQKLGWEYNDDYFVATSDEPICAYEDKAMAEAEAERIEASERAELRGTNLAKRFNFDHLSTSGIEYLATMFALEGTSEPPQNYRYPWLLDYYDDNWWSEIWNKVPEAKIWELCDILHLTEVVAVELEP